MFYRVMKSMSDWYALAVLWTYLAAFLIALALVFVFPLGPLILLFLGLASLGGVLLTARLLRSIKHRAARYSLNRGACPMCLADGQPRPQLGQPWRCEKCAAEFSVDGSEWIASAG